MDLVLDMVLEDDNKLFRDLVDLVLDCLPAESLAAVTLEGGEGQAQRLRKEN